MPFHIIKDHSLGLTKNVFTYIILLYILSTKAFFYSKSRYFIDKGLQLKALIAIMPEIRGIKLGLDRLPGGFNEKRSITEILQHFTTVEEINRATQYNSTHSRCREVQHCPLCLPWPDKP